jgi:hypothetical protein
MTDVFVNVAWFGAGMLCGSLVIAPKLYAAVTGTLETMSHDLNPRREMTAE